MQCVEATKLEISSCQCFTLADEDNEMTIFWTRSQAMTILIRDKKTTIPLTGGYQMSDLVTGWHKYSFTFKAGGSIKVLKY